VTTYYHDRLILVGFLYVDVLTLVVPHDSIQYEIWKEEDVGIRSLSIRIIIGLAAITIFTTHQTARAAQMEKDPKDIRTFVYPIVVSEEKLQAENAKLRKRKQGILLFRTLADGLACVYAVRDKGSTSYLLDKTKDILGVHTEEILYEAALENFLAIADASPSFFVSKGVDLLSETMLLVHVPVSAVKQGQLTDQLANIRSLILIPEKLIRLAEKEFDSPMPEEGYLMVVLQGEFLIAKPDNGNALRLRVFIDGKIRDKEDEIFLSQKIYRLNRQGVESLFKRDIKKFSQSG